MIRSSSPSKLLLCLLVLHCQLVRAVRTKDHVMATGASAGFDLKKCSPKIPYLDMRICVHASTTGIPVPVKRSWLSRLNPFKKPLPVELATEYIEEQGATVLADKSLQPQLAKFEIELGLSGCEGCTNNEVLESLSSGETFTDSEDGTENAYPYVKLVKQSRANQPGVHDLVSPHCVDVAGEMETLIAKVPRIANLLSPSVSFSKKGKKGAVKVTSKYCVYMAEHEKFLIPKTPFAATPPITIQFPSTQVCLDHLWGISGTMDKITFPLKVLPSTPLLCWSYDDAVSKHGPNWNKPEVPWFSVNYRVGEAFGLTDLLSGCFVKSDMSGKLVKAEAWCRNELGADSVLDIITHSNDFITSEALDLDEDEKRQMVAKFNFANALHECLGKKSDMSEKLKLANAWCEDNDVQDSASDLIEELDLKIMEKRKMQEWFDNNQPRDADELD